MRQDEIDVGLRKGQIELRSGIWSRGGALLHPLKCLSGICNLPGQPGDAGLQVKHVSLHVKAAKCGSTPAKIVAVTDRLHCIGSQVIEVFPYLVTKCAHAK